LAILITKTDEEVRKLDDYTGHLLIRDESSMALTVGADGSIKQDTIEGKHDPRTWDVTSAKLINIQLVISTALELITGLAAPKASHVPDVFVYWPSFLRHVQGTAVHPFRGTLEGKDDPPDKRGLRRMC
jgi:hypothetical protein